MLRISEETMRARTTFQWLRAPVRGLALRGCPTDDDDDSAAGDDDDVTEYEEGCILINGVEPGYANLADALWVAVEGDNITLCEGEFEGSVTVEKPVTLLGAGGSETVIVGDVNEMGITVTASDVTIAHLSVRSTRNGVSVYDAANVVLDDLIIEESGQFAVTLDGSQATLQNMLLAQNPAGAIQAEDSQLTLTGSQLLDNTGYGLKLTESSADLSTTAISGVVVPAETDDYDGTCLYAEDSTGTITLDTVQMSFCQRVGVYTFTTDVEITNVSIEESSNGVVAINGGDEMFSTVNDNYLSQVSGYGIYVIGQDSEVSRNTVTATNAAYGSSYGIMVGNDDATLTVEDNVVEGYQMFSMYVQYPYLDNDGPFGGTALVARNTVRDGALYGLYAQGLDEVVFTDNEVNGLVWSGDQPQANTYDSGMAVGLFDIVDLQMSGNLIHDVDVLGFFIQDSEFTSVDDEIYDTRLWAGYIGGSAGTFTNLYAHDTFIYGVDARTSAIDYVDCTFENAQAGVLPEYWGEEDPWETGGMAIQYTDSQGSVSNSTLTGSDYYGVYITESAVTVSDSDLSDNYAGIFARGDSASGFPIYVEDNHFGDHSWTAVYGYTSDAVVTGNTFDGVDGTALYGSTFYGTVSGNTFGNAGTAIQLYATDASLMVDTATYEDNEFNGNATGFSVSSYVGDMVISANTFDGVATPLSLGGGTAGDETLVADDNTFLGATSTPISISSWGDVAIGGTTTIDSCQSGPAIQLNGVLTSAVDGVTVASAAGSGIRVLGGVADISACDLTGAGENGIEIDGTSTPVTLDIADNVAISSNTGHGIWLAGTVTGAIVGNTISGNGGYGLACETAGVTIANCAGNTLADNVMGDLLEENGCSLAACVP